MPRFLKRKEMLAARARHSPSRSRKTLRAVRSAISGLSATADPRPVRLLPTTVTDALAVTPDQRTDAQKNALIANYQDIAPELDSSRQKLAQLRKELADRKPAMTAIIARASAGETARESCAGEGEFS